MTKHVCQVICSTLASKRLEFADFRDYSETAHFFFYSITQEMYVRTISLKTIEE